MDVFALLPGSPSYVSCSIFVFIVRTASLNRFYKRVSSNVHVVKIKNMKILFILEMLRFSFTKWDLMTSKSYGSSGCRSKCISFGRSKFRRQSHMYIFIYTPTVVLAWYVTHMDTQLRGGICYASLEVGWYSTYQPTSTKA